MRSGSMVGIFGAALGLFVIIPISILIRGGIPFLLLAIFIYLNRDKPKEQDTQVGWALRGVQKKEEPDLSQRTTGMWEWLLK